MYTPASLAPCPSYKNGETRGVGKSLGQREFNRGFLWRGNGIFIDSKGKFAQGIHSRMSIFVGEKQHDSPPVNHNIDGPVGFAVHALTDPQQPQERFVLGAGKTGC